MSLVTENELIEVIKKIIMESRTQVIKFVNSTMITTYWNIGKVIVQKQDGEDRAQYGDSVLDEISQQMSREFGKGFSTRNLRNMRAFYLAFPIWQTVSAELTWSHYLEIIKIDSELERSWYCDEAIKANWSVRQLQRAISTFTYNRILEHRPIEPNGYELEKYNSERPENNIKNPYIFDFLGLPINTKLYESDLEDALLNHLSDFLLELGKGFSLYARQFRILSEDLKTYHCDLLFYNTFLKCYIAIDLKIGKLELGDVAQIDMYRRYIDDKIKKSEDNPTVGLLLVNSSNETIVKYSILSENKNLFVSKYFTIMPSEEEFKKIIKEQTDLLALKIKR